MRDVLTPMLDQIKQLGGVFQGLTISGATVKGDTATFESVPRRRPPLQPTSSTDFKAVKIDGKWYVTRRGDRAEPARPGRHPRGRPDGIPV